MKRRPPAVAELPEVPVLLRWFRAPDWPVDEPPPDWCVVDGPDGPEVAVAWRMVLAHERFVEARRVWEAAHGVTVAEVAEAHDRQARTLEEMADLYADVDERPDPRWSL